MNNPFRKLGGIKAKVARVVGKLASGIDKVRQAGGRAADKAKPRFPSWVKSHFNATNPMVGCGLSSVDAVIISDYDGTDPTQCLRDFIVEVRNDSAEHNKVFNIYFNTGVLDANLEVEFLSVFVYCGIPFILSSQARLAGTTVDDADFDEFGGTLVSRISRQNCDTISSAGFVSVDVSPERYAYDFYTHNTLMESMELDASVLRMEVNSGRIAPVGHLYTPGGDLYEIFSLNSTQSKMIRRLKDFSTNPVDERSIPEGMQEIVLLGGDPDIVQLGDFVNNQGCLYSVWVPNEPRNYWLGNKILEEEWLPVNSFDIKYDDMIESYAMLYSELADLDNRADVDNGEEQSDELDSPSGLYVLDEQDYDSTEPIIFQNLPE